MDRQKIICVVGPTASGKTTLAIELAKRLSGEVVSCDSMQIYREIQIGTGKPTKEEQCGIPHHQLDVVSVLEPYSVARYCHEAENVINEIAERGKLPILAGGTGLYVDALLRGMEFSPQGDVAFREEFGKMSNEQLLEKLKEVDSESYERIHPNDRKRIIRALEVYEKTGHTISEHNERTKNSTGPYQALKIGLEYQNRQVLYDRIENRVDQMTRDGWMEETRKLMELISDPHAATALQAIGYRQWIRVIKGEISQQEALEEIKKETRHYAKRQLSWFHRDPEIIWLAPDELGETLVDRAENICRNFLEGGTA